MTRRQLDPLRPLTEPEHTWLAQLSRSSRAPAGQVARAKALLAVAGGASYTEAARLAGRRSGDAVSQVVARFNREGLAAVAPRHGGGPVAVYAQAECERILAEVRRPPDRDLDRTATWSLLTLRRALRRARMGCPRSVPLPSGACCTKPGGRGNAAVPGARLVAPCASASAGSSKSATRMLCPKKADRGRLHRRRRPGAGGLGAG
jgi:transposase